ncbi:MAG: hypothetical protein K2H76_03480 [Muribaculaceae bacterium]|nr:hypothetical protein [Muribaculaceae bacterium]
MDVLNRAEDLMETHPDSSLQILNSIEKTNLSSSEEKARYALLMSMALDKNYIDTTTFDVLQPAIDYYLREGGPDEKMKTYYYQGRIFQNQGDLNKAINSIVKSIDSSKGCKDSLSLARSYETKGYLSFEFYDFKSSIECYRKAAQIYHSVGHKDFEIDSYLDLFNTSIVEENIHLADSVRCLLKKYEPLDSLQSYRLKSNMISYFSTFGSKAELKKFIMNEENYIDLDLEGILNLALAATKIGENERAMSLLKYVEEQKANLDTLKYEAIKVSVLEGIGDDKGALEAYKIFNHALNLVDLAKFNQQTQSLNEKYQNEIKAEREAKRKSQILYLCGCLLLCLIGGIIIQSLRIKNTRTQKELALEKANNVTLENHKLQSEKELALERAKLAESDNEKLRIQKELALEQSKNIELENRTLKSEQERITAENRNLQLERDKKALEAENLAHRVESLEEESESLKTLLSTPEDLPPEVRDAIKTRVEMLNSLLASYITTNDKMAAPYDVWVKELTANTEKFMDSNRLAFTASHPRFIKYFEDHDLTVSEINYLCLYALGLKGKEVGNYIKKRSHVNISSAIRKKLGIDKHETNIGIYVRKLLKSL